MSPGHVGAKNRFPPISAVHAANPAGRVSEGQETPDAGNPAMGYKSAVLALQMRFDVDLRARAPAI